MMVTITVEGGRLHAQPAGQNKLALSAESEDTFFTGLVLDQGGRKTTASKVRR